MNGRKLRDFLDREIHQVLVDEHFVRINGIYVQSGPARQAALVSIAKTNWGNPGLFDFAIQYGLHSPWLAEFHGDQGVGISENSFDHALLTAQVFAPSHLESYRETFPYRWVVDPSNREEIGRLVRESLILEVLPSLQEWYDPAALGRALENPRRGLFPGLPQARALAMALAPLGDGSTDLHMALAQLPPDDVVGTWIARRIR